jgi:hypothetical protein
MNRLLPIADLISLDPMWRIWILLVVLLLAGAQLSRGEDRLLKQEVASRFLHGSRTVRIYLPPSYHREPNRRYPVLYLHDGQNIFSSAGTNICFGRGSWELDKTVDDLCQAKKMQEIVLVAVDNNATPSTAGNTILPRPITRPHLKITRCF